MRKGILIKRNGIWYIKYKKGNSLKTKEIVVNSEFDLTDNLDETDVEFEFNDAGVLQIIKTAEKKIRKPENETPTQVTQSSNIGDLKTPEGYMNASLTKKTKGVELSIDETQTFWVPLKSLSNFSDIKDDDVFIKISGPTYVESILYAGNEIIIQRTNDKSTGNAGEVENTVNRQSNDEAHAPYNFIPINEKIVDSDLYSEGFDLEKIRFDKFHSDLYSGYVELSIEALTKVFIGSGEKDNDGRYLFFAPDGKPRIPGSTLRGMVRTLIEICSWGQFKQYDNKQLFYRSFDTTSTGISYCHRMVKNKGVPKANAGYLYMEGKNYYIKPALCNSDLCNTSYYRVNYEKNNKDNPNFRHVKGLGFVKEFERKQVYFIPVAISLHNDHTHSLKYADLGEVYDTNDGTRKEGLLISSGHIYSKKHMHWVMNMPDNSDSAKISVPKAVILTYNNDNTRKIPKEFQLDYTIRNSDVPCFYLENDNNEVIAIGHTPYFRLPYRNKIGDLLPEEHKKYDRIDIPTAIFGSEPMDIKNKAPEFAGRVYFEDVLCKNTNLTNDNESYIGLDTAISPKPTSFQLYLKQDDINVPKKELKHYDSENASLRGYKMYWHHKATKGNTSTLEFRPAKIRFTNLSKIELGALIFVLDLPPNCHHKIGMGKPLGLGSVHIKPMLFIDDYAEKYKSFSTAMNYEPEKQDLEIKEEFKNDFIEYIKCKLQLDTNSDIWETDRLQNLKALLRTEDIPTQNKYMDFMVQTERSRKKFNPKFANREVLPDAKNVK